MKYYTEFCKVTDWRGFMVEKKIFIPVDHIFLRELEKLINEKKCIVQLQSLKKIYIYVK